MYFSRFCNLGNFGNSSSINGRRKQQQQLLITITLSDIREQRGLSTAVRVCVSMGEGDGVLSSERGGGGCPASLLNAA